MSTTVPDALAEPRPDSAQGSGRNTIALLFAGLMVTQLLASLNQTVLSTALPTIVGELGGVNQMSWVITGYILASTIMMPIYGRISDLLGRKPVIIAAILIFLAGSVVGALAPDIWWLIVSRVIQGIGGGGLMILSQAAIADVIPARDRGRYMGIMGAVFAVSSVAGPLIGGWLTEGPGWRWAFWLNLPLGLLAILAAVFFLKLPRRRSAAGRIDYLGMALLAAATTSIVLVCTWGGHQYAWVSPQIAGLIVASVALAALFVVVERRAEQPVIPMTLFADRNFALSTVAALLIGVMMFGAIGYFPTYLQMVTGVDATRAGLLMAPMMGSLLVASILSGQLVSRTGRYKKFPLIGTVVMGAGLALMAALTVDSPIWWMCTVLGVFGVGIGLSNQILTLIVQNSVPNRIVGTATAASNYFRQVGATIGSAIVGSMFVQRLGESIAERLPDLGSDGAGGINSLTPDVVSNLPDALRLPIIESYNEALLPIFLFMVPLAALAFIVLLFLRETSLATRIERERERS
ncbi:MAG TPA: MDR family MFS transporter [Arachnia sp.]|nr:MDR family MFS transporter [Arachnia sp.]HMT84770.1 MDR family MFS transporter [Arachnia sp.]